MKYSIKKHKGYTTREFMLIVIIAVIIIFLAIPLFKSLNRQYEADKRDDTVMNLTSTIENQLEYYDSRLNTPTSLFSEGSNMHANIAESCGLDDIGNLLLIGAYDYNSKPSIAEVESRVSPQDYQTTWVVLLPHHSYNKTLPPIDMLEADTVNLDFEYPIITFIFDKGVETQVYIDGINYTNNYGEIK